MIWVHSAQQASSEQWQCFWIQRTFQNWQLKISQNRGFGVWITLLIPSVHWDYAQKVAVFQFFGGGGDIRIFPTTWISSAPGFLARDHHEEAAAPVKFHHVFVFQWPQSRSTDITVRETSNSSVETGTKTWKILMNCKKILEGNRIHNGMATFWPARVPKARNVLLYCIAYHETTSVLLRTKMKMFRTID